MKGYIVMRNDNIVSFLLTSHTYLFRSVHSLFLDNWISFGRFCTSCHQPHIQVPPHEVRQVCLCKIRYAQVRVSTVCRYTQVTLTMLGCESVFLTVEQQLLPCLLIVLFIASWYIWFLWIHLIWFALITIYSVTDVTAVNTHTHTHTHRLPVRCWMLAQHRPFPRTTEAA